jgi:NlpC/P60 family putative phage cell wall peptidase
MQQDPLAQQVVEETLSWLGTPYRHQASVRGIGCDCLGLIRGVWRNLYGSEPAPLPVYTPDWAERGSSELLKSAADQFLLAQKEPGPGSVLLFRMRPSSPIKHCGILVSKTEFVHAYWGRLVCRSAYGRWWRSHMAFAYQFPLER